MVVSFDGTIAGPISKWMKWDYNDLPAPKKELFDVASSPSCRVSIKKSISYSHFMSLFFPQAPLKFDGYRISNIYYISHLF